MVLDASVLVGFLLDRPGAARVADVLANDDVAAPHLVDAEVAQVIRRYTARGDVTDGDGAAMLDDFLDLSLVRYSHAPLLRRAYELRHNATIYDALYLALAEGLGCPLLTADQSLAALPGCHAAVEVLIG